MSQRFCHSGDLGDIIYSLPTIKAAGGGTLTLYHHPGRTAHGMTKAKADKLRPLLESQDYIDRVEFAEGIHPHNLNGFRDHWGHGNLADMHLATHGMTWHARVEPWLTVEPAEVADVIFHRTARYRNGRFPWAAIVEHYQQKLGADCVFVGNKVEYKDFINCFGMVQHYDWGNFGQLAQAIAGCKLFVGNQSSPLAVAHGLKHRVIMEICPESHSQQHCVYQRMNCIIGWDQKIELPDL